MTRSLFLTLLWCLCAVPAAAAEQAIAIIGTGNVARALGPTWAQAGHRIRYGTRDKDRDEVRDLVSQSGPDAFAGSAVQAVDGADVVVLAVPASAALDLASELDLADKVVIDCTNNLRFENGLVKLVTPPTARVIQDRAQGAHVVKTLNTINARFMTGSGAPEGITLPIAGDSDEAKRVVAELIGDIGLVSRDVGPLYNAAYVEAMGALYVYMNVFGDPERGMEYGLVAR